MSFQNQSLKEQSPQAQVFSTLKTLQDSTAALETAKVSRKERNKNRKKENLLNHAKAVFIAKGFLQTSIEDIARHADIAVGSIYNFFRNKDDLYLQIVQSIFQEFSEQFEKNCGGLKSLKEVIREIIFSRIKFFIKYRAFSFGLMEAVSEGVFAREKTFKKACLEFRDIYLQKILKAFQPYKKDLPKFDLMYLALSLEGTITSCIFHLAHNKTAKDPLQMAKELTLYFLSLLGLENMAKDIKAKTKRD